MASDNDRDYGLEMPFWIDTDAYTDRDREMFVAGVEFQQIYTELKSGWRGSKPVHRENESRLRMMCGKLGVPCSIKQTEGYEGWSEFNCLGDDEVDYLNQSGEE